MTCYDATFSHNKTDNTVHTTPFSWPAKPEAVLLDLGNVVLDVDFRRAFIAWSTSSGLPEERFHSSWAMDAPYQLHETGDLNFRQYVEHLSGLFEVRMSLEAWRQGWNAIFVDLLPEVMPLLTRLQTRMPLYAFTNTNPTHEAAWRRGYPELKVFRHIFVSSRIGRRKPDVAAYHLVAHRIGHSPEDIWFLDDNRDNVLGASAAGLQSFRIRTESDVVQILNRLLEICP